MAAKFPPHHRHSGPRGRHHVLKLVQKNNNAFIDVVVVVLVIVVIVLVLPLVVIVGDVHNKLQTISISEHILVFIYLITCSIRTIPLRELRMDDTADSSFLQFDDLWKEFI